MGADVFTNARLLSEIFQCKSTLDEQTLTKRTKRLCL
jgi:hypothetical protein